MEKQKKQLAVAALAVIIAAALLFTVTRMRALNRTEFTPVQSEWFMMDPEERDRQLTEQWKEMGLSDEDIAEGLRMYRERDEQ